MFLKNSCSSASFVFYKKCKTTSHLRYCFTLGLLRSGLMLFCTALYGLQINLVNRINNGFPKSVMIPMVPMKNPASFASADQSSIKSVFLMRKMLEIPLELGIKCSFVWRWVCLRDEHFWQDLRKELICNQWKWVRHFVIDGLSIKEITKIENVSKSAVKSWARETRKKLRTKDFERKIVEAVGG